MLRFLVQTAGRPDRTVDVEGEAAVAGSDPSLPIVIDDPAASPRHFEIEVRGIGAVLKDLASENGTKVNGSYVSQLKLAAGDVIEVGKTRVVFVLSSEVVEDAPPPIERPAAAIVPPPAAAPAPAVVPAGPAPRYSRRQRGPAALIVLAFGVVFLAAVGVAVFLYLKAGKREPVEVAEVPAEPQPAPAAPVVEVEAPPPEFKIPDRLKKKDDRAEPAEAQDEPEEEPEDEPDPEPEPAPEPAPVPAAPVPDADAEARAERERLEAEARGRLETIEETLADRIARYSFDGPVADLEKLLAPLKDGPVAASARGLLDDLVRARRAFSRMRDLLSNGDGKKIELSSGLSLVVTGADEEGFDARVGSAQVRKKWTELDPASIHGVLRRSSPDAEEWLDLSAFAALFDLGTDRSEEDLARAFKKDAGKSAEISAVLARRRGMDFPPGGFVLYDDEWVTVEERGYLEKGLTKYQGKWLTHDELMTARGFVKHEGRWLSPEDYEEVLEAQREVEALAKKYMPKGLIDKPGNGDSVPWEDRIKLKTPSKRYTIQTNLSRDVANDIAYTMEILRTNLQAQFGLRKKGAKFTINVVANHDEYLKVWPRAGMSLGFCSSSEICTFYQPPMTTSVLMHEGTHQILRQFCPTTPRWLHEGVATYFECSRFEFDPKKRRVGLRVGMINSNRLVSFQTEHRAGHSVSLETFITGKGGNPYSQGWAFVYYLAKGKNGEYSRHLHSFIEEAHKTDVVERFKKVFKVKDFAKFEAEWLEYIMSLNPADGVRLSGRHQ